MASTFEALLGASWNLLGSERRPPTRPMSIFDIAMNERPISEVAFGRFVALPNCDAPVPIEPPPPAAPVPPPLSLSTRSGTGPLLALAPKPKLQYTSMRAHPSAEEANSRLAALKTWVDIVSALKGASNAFLQMRGEVTTEALEPYLATKRTGTLAMRASA